MEYKEKDNKICYYLIIGCFFIAFLLSYLVFRKTTPNFPVMFRKNDLGINLLGARNSVWEVPILGLFFILVNHFLASFYARENKNLKKLLFFVNMGVALLVLLISAQIYYLNL